MNPVENFADKWAEEPKKRENFYGWLDQVRQDFALYLRGSRFEVLPEVLKRRLGTELVERTLNAVIPAAAVELAAPAIVKGASAVDSMGRAQSEIDELQRTGTQSKPWARS